MKDVRHEIAAKACMRTGSTLSPHASPHLFKSLMERVWDPINGQVWFGVHDVFRGHTPVSIPPDLVIIKTNRPQ